nr:hypothetical protein [Nocardioides daphniae]
MQDLGRQVAGGSEQPALRGELGVVGEAREPEVDEDGRTSLHQDVGGLDVAVHDADVVDRADRLGQAAGEPDQLVTLQGADLTHLVVQRVAGDVAGRHERHVAPRVGVDDLGDPPAAHAQQRVDLAGQPGARLVVTDDVGADHLEGDPLPRGAARQVHDPHATFTQAREQLVAADAQPGRGRWGRGWTLTT